MATVPAVGALTDEQARAVTCRSASVVLASGAGCGKTHVLTERYLSHLRDDGAEVGQIVAITFTDRAARQMRQRIRRAVTRHVRDAADDDEAARWARHLRNLETAPISTIHAFCGALLRQNAIEAGIDPRFDVLEDMLAVNLEADALADCLQGLLTSQSETGEHLRQLVLLYGWSQVGATVQHLMRARDPLPWQSWLNQQDEQIAAGWLEHAREVVRPLYKDYLLSSNTQIADCLARLRGIRSTAGPLADNVDYVLRETPRLSQAGDFTATVEKLHETAKLGPHRKKAWANPDDHEAIRDAFEAYRAAAKKLSLPALDAAPEDLHAAIVVGKRWLRVAQAATDAYKAKKRQHGVLDFQDLLLLARDLLRDHADVRELLQERYSFLLIDELQDTDPVQMELVEHLCGAERDRGKLFAVGDHSQSIYRFRGADVARFQGLRDKMPHEGRLGLTRNFRSQPAILQFVNALLGRRLTAYEPLEAHHSQVNPGPCVEFLWSRRGDKESIAEARSREADRIARRIAAMIGREQLVVERRAGAESLRPVRAGDVVLLFRAMSNVQLYEAALRQRGLDYYLVGGRAFYAQQEIYDILNLLRALENPRDAVSLAGTLRSPFCCLSDEALFMLSRHEHGLWSGLHDSQLVGSIPAEQVAHADRARRNLDRWHRLKDRLPIARLLGAVFADSGYDAAAQFEFLGDRKLANLWKLMDMARTFDRSGLFGLAEFIQRLGDLVKGQPREEQAATQPENADVVRLMTIHQAKGLEFAVVFVPDMTADRRGPHESPAQWNAALGCVARPPMDEEEAPFVDFGWQLWTAQEKVEQWHEDLRALYVACTRAQDYLVLSGSLKRPLKVENPWMITLAECFELETGECLVDGSSAENKPRVCVASQSEDEEAGPAKRAHPRKTAVIWDGNADRAAAIPAACAEVGEPFDAEDGSDLSAWPA